MATKKSRSTASRKKAARKTSSKKRSSRKLATKKKAVRKAPSKKAAKPVRKTAAKRAARPTKTAGSGNRARSSSRQRVYNLTRDVPEHQYFVLANGKPIRHVAELASILDQIEDHVFHHHVSADKNDFHNWVRDVFEDVELARKITGVGDKKHLQLVIYKHLAGHE